MSNDKLEAQLHKLGGKINKLLAQYKGQQATIQQLQKENKVLKQKASQSQVPNASFSNKPKIGTIIKNKDLALELGGSIDKYISEIEQSIAYLEQLQ